MYKWYFGVNNAPERKSEAIAQIVLGMGGGSLVVTALFIMIFRWWLV